MKRAIIAPAEFGGAALDELKHWLTITTAQDDTALVALLSASADMCEAFCGMMPLAATCEEIWPARGEWQQLTTRPVHAITAVEGIPAEGPRFTMPADAFELDLGDGQTGSFRILRKGAAGRVAVRFAAGFAPGWGSLPEGLRQGIIRYAGHLYRERDAEPGGSPPAAVTALWRPWRQLRIA